MPHHNPNISQWFLSFIYMLSKLYVFSWLHVSLFHLVEHEPFYKFHTHPGDGLLDSPLTVT